MNMKCEAVLLELWVKDSLTDLINVLPLMELGNKVSEIDELCLEAEEKTKPQRGYHFYKCSLSIAVESKKILFWGGREGET